MVREQLSSDLERLMEIWLEANRTAHAFIPASFWEERREEVREALPSADVLVWEDEDGVKGFLGMMNGFIAGLFVAGEHRGKGVGARLLSAAKERCPKLALDVYVRNARARVFYERNGFVVGREKINQTTGEAEYEMLWERGSVE